MKELENYCELHWWNCGKKTLQFKGQLKELNITFTKRKDVSEGLYWFKFKSAYDITFKTRCTLNDFPIYAKKFIQMEMVRMGDKSQLYVQGTYRPVVNVNF